jgi:hypothetical protein
MSLPTRALTVMAALAAVVLMAAAGAGAAVVTSPTLGAGWNLVSVPLDPVDPDPAAVFKNESGVAIPISGRFHRYDHDAAAYRTYYSSNPAEFGDVKRGDGYWLYLTSATKISYDAQPLSQLEVPLATTGWYLIGTPKDATVSLQDVQVTNQTQGRTVGLYNAIYVEHWLGPKLFWYGPSGGYAAAGFDPWCEMGQLDPWRGYWVRAQAANLSLVVPFDELPPPGLIRGMAHYGEGDLLPYSQTSDRATSCAALRNEMKGRVARVFVSSLLAGPVETGDRLRDTIAVARTYDIYLIVCLTDMYNASQMHPMGDNVYYTVPGAGYSMLNHEFWSSGYTVNYLPQVQYLVNRFKDEPRIFAWQLGNEIRDLSSTSTFITWCETVHDAIRAIDPHHMINPGVSRFLAGFSSAQALALYDDRFDFLVGHAYNGSDSEDDTGIASTVGKPFIVGEAGFDSRYYSDRPSQTNADISKWINRGARGYLQWGFMATSYDIGDGDGYFGVDHALHGDWTPYMATYSYWGNLLSGS